MAFRFRQQHVFSISFSVLCAIIFLKMLSLPSQWLPKARTVGFASACYFQEAMFFSFKANNKQTFFVESCSTIKTKFSMTIHLPGLKSLQFTMRHITDLQTRRPHFQESVSLYKTLCLPFIEHH